MSPFTIGIIGSGAIGTYYGANLAKHGHDVHFLTQSAYTQLQRSGLQIEEKDPKNKRTSFSIPAPNVYLTTEAMPKCDIIIIALKTTNNDLIEKITPPLISSKSILVTLQNGLGNAELLECLFPDNPVVGGLCHTCINRTSATKTTSILHGTIQFGSLSPSQYPHLISEVFTHANIKNSVSESLNYTIWKKLCWNIPFNGLSITKGGITTDKIINDPVLQELAFQLMKEVQAIANAYDFEISNEYLNKQIELTRSIGAYKPSSLLDFQANKPIEIQSIWGEAIQKGRNKNIHIPLLEALFSTLQSLAGTI